MTRAWYIRIPFLTSVKEITRFVVMLDFCRPHIGFCHDVVMMHSHGIHGGFLPFFRSQTARQCLREHIPTSASHANTPTHTHTYAYTYAHTHAHVPPFPAFLKFVTLNLFLTRRVPFRIICRSPDLRLFERSYNIPRITSGVFPTFLSVSIRPL